VVSRYIIGDRVTRRIGTPITGTVVETGRESKLGYSLQVEWEGGGVTDKWLSYEHPDDVSLCLSPPNQQPSHEGGEHKHADDD